MEATAMVWEWPIWLYLWAAGVAGGGYFAAFLVNLFTGQKHKRLLKIATWVGLPLVLLGVLLLIIDLGHQLRAWHLFTRFYFGAPMSLGTWILFLWSVVAAVLIVLWLAEFFGSREQTGGLLARVAAWLRPLLPITGILTWIELALSVLLIIYTGVLLSNTNTAMWVSVLLPTLFVVSAIATGFAATLFVATLLGEKLPHEFGRASAILTVLEVVVLIAFLLTVPAGVLISGSMALWFWLGVILVGLLVPLGLEVWTLRTQATTPLVLLAAVCVLLGGLILRAVIVVGGQI